MSNDHTHDPSDPSDPSDIDEVDGSDGVDGAGFDDTAEDRALRGRMAALDPVATLPAADPAWVARLVQEARSDEGDLDVPETRQTGVHDRSRLTWLVAAAAFVLIAAVGAFALVDRGDDDVPAAGPGSADTRSSSDPSTGSTGRETGETTVLSAPAGVGSGRCAVASADVLARQTLAFDATVTALTDGLVTLEPTKFYAGEPTDVVEVQAPPRVLSELLLAVDFEEGERYLVSAVEGEVSVCGYSGAWSPELERLYVAAFAG